jgi:hypothetical protein
MNRRIEGAQENMKLNSPAYIQKTVGHPAIGTKEQRGEHATAAEFSTTIHS